MKLRELKLLCYTLDKYVKDASSKMWQYVQPKLIYEEAKQKHEENDFGFVLVCTLMQEIAKELVKDLPKEQQKKLKRELAKIEL